MSSDFAVDVIDAVIALRHHYDTHTIPSDTLIGRARGVLNAADRQIEKPSEQVETDLDHLYGLFTWSRLVASLAYLDPRVLGLERTRRRLEKSKRETEASEQEETRMEAVAAREAAAAATPTTPDTGQPAAAYQSSKSRPLRKKVERQST